MCKKYPERAICNKDISINKSVENENTVKEEFYCEGLSGNVFKTPVGCFNNISITEQEYTKKIQESDDTNDVDVFCYNKELKGKRNAVMIFKNKCNEKRGWKKASQYQIDKKLALMNKSKFDLKKINKQESEGFFTDSEYLIKMRKIPREAKGVQQEKKTASFDELALSLGCGSKSKNVKDCVRRYLPSVAGTGPLTKEQIKEIKKNKELMGEIVFAIQELNRQQNQSQSEPSEKEKQQALAQQNSSGKVTWKYTSSGIGYWDYGNGFGWAPPNPIRDRIIQGFFLSQRTKNMLMTGSKGKTIFIPR